MICPKKLNILFLCTIFVIVTSNEKTDESSIEYETGEIHINDTDLTILINSTVKNLEGDRNTMGETSNLTVQPSESKKVKPMGQNNVPLESIPKTRRMQKLSPQTYCRKYNENEKYQLLENIGGRNQMFMADSAQEASRNFRSSIHFNPVQYSMNDNVKMKSFASKNDCDDGCRLIQKTIEMEIARRDNGTNMAVPQAARIDSMAMFSTFEAPTPQNVSPCSLGDFVPIGVCSDLGEPVNNDYESLCSECSGVYILSENCFPRIFNAVQCNPQEMGCIFETITDKAHGQCTSQSLSFKVLRNNGDGQCENWVTEQIQLPIACQCALSRNSFLRSRPN